MNCEVSMPVGGLDASKFGIHRWMSCTRFASFSFCRSLSFWRSFEIWISSALEPLDVERTIFSGDGVDTDILRDRSSGRTGDAGVPERIAGVIERCPTLVGWTEADRV